MKCTKKQLVQIRWDAKTFGLRLTESPARQLLAVGSDRVEGDRETGREGEDGNMPCQVEVRWLQQWPPEVGFEDLR